MVDPNESDARHPVFEQGESSTRARRQHVADLLRAIDAGRLSDAFLSPVVESTANVLAMSRRVETVRWRNREAPFFLRAEDVPFDLLPFRANAPEREGAYFSLGPGLSRSGAAHPAVLLVQVEGPDAAARADGIEEALGDRIAPPLRAQLSDDGRPRICLASHVVLHRSPR